MQCQVWQSSCLSPVVFLGFSRHYFVPSEPHKRCLCPQQLKRPLARQAAWKVPSPHSRAAQDQPPTPYGSSAAQEGEEAAHAAEP